MGTILAEESLGASRQRRAQASAFTCRRSTLTRPAPSAKQSPGVQQPRTLSTRRSTDTRKELTPWAGHPHDELLDQIKEEFPDILQHTSQGVYIPMDDPRWICNDRLATMIGCASAAEPHSLASASPFLDVTVAAESQERVVNAYMNSVNDKVASSIPVTWKKKGGATLNTETIFVPISYEGTALTIHFATPI